MFESSLSIWESMNSFFTPTILFILLNLVIGTIAFTSTLANQKSHHNSNNNHQQEVNGNYIARTQSVIQRLKSVNFYAHYRSQYDQEQDNPSNLINELDQDSEAHGNFQENHVENYMEKETLMDFDGKDLDFDQENELPSMDEVFSKLTGGNFSRTKSDTEVTSGTRLNPSKMMKSASLKSAFGRFETEERVEARRPATVREKGNAKVTDCDGDKEVDTKADDFINRFKQQLKVQRMDSIVRYKDAMGRNAGR